MSNGSHGSLRPAECINLYRSEELQRRVETGVCPSLPHVTMNLTDG